MIGAGSAIGAGATIADKVGIPGAGQVSDVAGDAFGTVTDSLGISAEKKQDIPESLPRSPQKDSPIAGSVYQGGTGDGTPFNKTSLQLHYGLYNYDDLSKKGLHDEISGVKVRDGWKVTLFTGVEGGQPAGRKEEITGPRRIPELRDAFPGMENAISAITVEPTDPSILGNDTGGNFGGGTGDYGSDDGRTGGGTGGGTTGGGSTGGGGTGGGGTGGGGSPGGGILTNPLRNRSNKSGSNSGNDSGSSSGGGMLSQLQSSLLNPITLAVVALAAGAYWYG
jgi:hypothetical protein